MSCVNYGKSQNFWASSLKIQFRIQTTELSSRWAEAGITCLPGNGYKHFNSTSSFHKFESGLKAQRLDMWSEIHADDAPRDSFSLRPEPEVVGVSETVISYVKHRNFRTYFDTSQIICTGWQTHFRGSILARMARCVTCHDMWFDAFKRIICDRCEPIPKTFVIWILSSDRDATKPAMRTAQAIQKRVLNVLWILLDKSDAPHESVAAISAKHIY
jgi:hypothetical protein